MIFRYPDTYLDSLRNLGLKILGSSHWFNAVIVQTSDSLLLDSLSTTVSFIDPFDWQTNYYSHSAKKNNTSVPFTDLSSPLPKSENYGMSDLQIRLLNGNTLHDLGYRGQTMQIAVIDAGFYRVDSLSCL